MSIELYKIAFGQLKGIGPSRASKILGKLSSLADFFSFSERELYLQTGIARSILKEMRRDEAKFKAEQQLVFNEKNDVQTHFFIPLEPLFDLGPYFLMGSLLSCFDFDNMPAKNAMAAVLSLALVASVYFKIGHTVVYFTLPFLVIYVGKQTSRLATWVHTTMGDPSYGIYLYAFPMQQLIAYLFPSELSPLSMIVLSTAGTLPFAVLSWRLIESPALNLRSRLSKKSVQ